jgi:hypothetical protein
MIAPAVVADLKSSKADQSDGVSAEHIRPWLRRR